jgi:hypothetical protein
MWIKIMRSSHRARYDKFAMSYVDFITLDALRESRCATSNLSTKNPGRVARGFLIFAVAGVDDQKR